MFEYRELEYFNTDDMYLFFPLGERMFESKLLFQNSWYTIEGLQYKATSIPCMKGTVIGKKCVLRKTGHTGIIINKLQGTPLKQFGYYIKQYGIYWDGGEQIQKKGMPFYWQSQYDIDILL